MSDLEIKEDADSSMNAESLQDDIWKDDPTAMSPQGGGLLAVSQFSCLRSFKVSKIKLCHIRHMPDMAWPGPGDGVVGFLLFSPLGRVLLKVTKYEVDILPISAG